MKEKNLKLNISIPLAVFYEEKLDIELLNIAVSNVLLEQDDDTYRLCFVGELFDHAVGKIRDSLELWHKFGPQEKIYPNASTNGNTTPLTVEITEAYKYDPS